jgi:hypothetical protein
MLLEGHEVLMKAVHTVNLSGSLLSSWTEVAHIARHLRGLRTLVLRYAPHIPAVRHAARHID